MAILIKFGDKHKGESKIKGYTDHFEVGSFQLGVGRAVSDARGTSGRQGSVASISEIVVTKSTDGISLKLWQESVMGKLDNKVDIVFVRTGAGEPVEYLKFELEGCGISGFSMSSGGDRPSESISLNFDKIVMHYSAIGDDLTGESGNFGWNLAESAKV